MMCEQRTAYPETGDQGNQRRNFRVHLHASLSLSATTATQTLWLRIGIAARGIAMLLQVLQGLRRYAEPLVDFLIRNPPVKIGPQRKRLRKHLRIVDRHAHLHGVVVDAR